MLTKELKLELVEFIIKKANSNLPTPFLNAIKEKIFSQLNSVFDFSASSELCLSLYYGIIFNTLSQFPIGPLNVIEASTTEGESAVNWLVSKDFFQQLLIHHRESLLNNAEIQTFLSILDKNQEDELATLLFKSFNDYLVDNFTISLTVQDLTNFIQTELEYLINQQMENEVLSSLVEEPEPTSLSANLVLKTETFEELQLTLTQFLDELAPKLLGAMSQDEMFQACEYSEEYFKAYLREAFQLKKWVEGFVDRDRHYLRNEAGHFIRNDKTMIWDQMNDIYNRQKTGEEAIRELFELMITSKAGFEHYHREFFEEFKELSQTQALNPKFKKRIQETLCQLAYLKMEHEFKAFN